MSTLLGLRITSLTPNALTSDSRTLKQAASLSRAGAQSIVIEGRPSRLKSSAGITVISNTNEPIENRDLEPGGGWWSYIARKAKGAGRWAFFTILPAPLKELWMFVGVIKLLIVREWWPAFRKLPKSDVYILHSFHFLPAVVLRSRISGGRCIYDAHDFYREMSGDIHRGSFAGRWLIPFYAWMDKKAVCFADACITVSSGVATLYRKADGVSPMVFRNLHDCRIDLPPSKTLREVLNLGNDDFLIVATGNAKPGTSLQMAIKALLGFAANVHLAFVGKDYEELEIETKLTFGDLAKRVHFPGPVPAEQVVPFISDADCAIILYYSLSENYESALPNRFFQSIAAGLPLIYPRLTEMHSIVQQVGCGIAFEPNSYDELAKAVRQIFEDVRLRGNLKKQAVEAATKLSWASEDQEFVQLVARIARTPVN